MVAPSAPVELDAPSSPVELADAPVELEAPAGVPVGLGVPPVVPAVGGGDGDLVGVLEFLPGAA